MNRRQRVEPIRRQRTIFYDAAGNVDRSFEFYAHMFREDVALSIMPIGGNSSRPNFKIALSPENDEVQQIITPGLKPGYSRHSLTKALCDFLKMLSAN